MNRLTMPQTSLDAALLYDRYGRVLPLCWTDDNGRCACPIGHNDVKEVGKAPLTARGVYDASSRPGEIDFWFKQKYPQSIVGLARVNFWPAKSGT